MSEGRPHFNPAALWRRRTLCSTKYTVLYRDTSTSCMFLCSVIVSVQENGGIQKEAIDYLVIRQSGIQNLLCIFSVQHTCLRNSMCIVAFVLCSDKCPTVRSCFTYSKLHSPTKVSQCTSGICNGCIMSPLFDREGRKMA